MAFDFLQSDADALFMQEGLCVTATAGGIAFRGTRSVLKRQDAATLQGADERYTFSLLVSRSEVQRCGLALRPLKDRVTIAGSSYLVMDVQTDVAGHVRYDLGGTYG